MLSAYAKRQSNLPTPGQYTESLTEAKKFADNFEIQAIEIIDFAILMFGEPLELHLNSHIRGKL